ncbi:MAG: hypothetical protein HUU27_05945 [Phycisphaerae bacterium]|nr:hypothetical protein [Phycisphaerae bacterium]
MSSRVLKLCGSVLTGMVVLGAAAGMAQESDLLTEDNVVSGTMQIEFKTRTTPDTTGEFVEGSPALNVQDVYTLSLAVAGTTEFAGKIVRQPNIYTKNLRRLKQGAALGYDISLAVLNPRDPKQKKVVGKWVGVVPIDTGSGAYDLSGGAKEERPLRVAVDTVGRAQGFTENFAGKLMGKAEKKDSLAAYTFKRAVGQRTVEVVVKRSDPMRFADVQLAKGPAEVYGRARVNGRLDYDYETGNWYTDGIRFVYNLNGKDVEDVVTGSIKWVEDENRASNGKGYYEFNLRFNEEKHRTASTEAAAFEKMSDEEAFFAVDNTVPSLTGRISYEDTFIPGGDTPSSSKVTYGLHANKLSKQQIMNFVKLWLLAVGPTNDE